MPFSTDSSAQRFAEGERAEATRRARRQMLDQVAAGAESVRSVLNRAETDDVVAKTKISQLVQALPGYGPGKVVSALKRAGIEVHSRVETLEPTQRKALLDVLV